MDYSELVKALTCGNDGKLPCHNNECPYWVDQWHVIGLCNVIKKDADAAAVIEELQAEIRESMQKCAECGDRMVEPKRGKWKRDEKRWGENSIRCSLCGAVIEDEEWVWRNWNYCYHCGAKMTGEQDVE